MPKTKTPKTAARVYRAASYALSLIHIWLGERSSMLKVLSRRSPGWLTARPST